MRSFRALKDDRRRIFLALTGSVESKLRDAYSRLHQAGEITQASLAAKLGVDKSTVHRRLNGAENMTLKSVADMVWGLGYCIEVDIFDPADRPERNDLVRSHTSQGVAGPPGVIITEGEWPSWLPTGKPNVAVRHAIELADA